MFTTMFHTTIADPDGVIHQVTLPTVDPTLHDGHGVRIKVTCEAPIGVEGMIAARYARTLNHPVFRSRNVTCKVCR